MPVQMSDSYIVYQYGKLLENPTDSDLYKTGVIIQAAFEAGKIKKVVVGLDRNQAEMFYVPIE